MWEIVLLSICALVRAKAIDIDVGKGAALAFAPNTLTASVGDTLNFHFYNGSGGHSVVSGPFSSPCEPATDAFFSGYIKGDLNGDMTFIVTVNSTDPTWFYCSLPGHCMSGMVGVVNPPSGQTVSDYVNNASGLRGSAPAVAQGGVVTTLSPGGVTTMTGSSSMQGVSAETTMPTSTGTGTGSVTTTKGTGTGSVAATSTPSGGGKSNDASVMLGLGVLGGVFVALMS